MLYNNRPLTARDIRSISHDSLSPLHSTLQTASRSSQPFFHNSQSLPTDGQTDRQTLNLVGKLKTGCLCTISATRTKSSQLQCISINESTMNSELKNTSSETNRAEVFHLSIEIVVIHKTPHNAPTDSRLYYTTVLFATVVGYLPYRCLSVTSYELVASKFNRS